MKKKISQATFEAEEPRILFSADGLGGMDVNLAADLVEPVALEAQLVPESDNTNEETTASDTPLVVSEQPYIETEFIVLNFDQQTNDSDIDNISSVLDNIEGVIIEEFEAVQQSLVGEETDNDEPINSTIDTSTLTDTADTQPHELVFIDTDVENYQQLLNDVMAQGDEDRNIEVIVLDNERNGIEQISEVLSTYQNLDSVHLISHGSDGSIDIGNTQLDSDILSQNIETIESWSESFTTDGDFLIYGCNLAASEDGQSLINSLSQLTQADVAASDDLTGSAELGGDWDLEYIVGEIESSVIVDEQAQEAFEGVLAAPVANPDSYTVAEGGTLTVDTSNTLTEHTITTVADGARFVSSADVDGDGDLDVLVASDADDTIAWYENDGSENFTKHTITTSADAAHWVEAADMDGDGDLDVLAASTNDDTIAWYENDGSENFTEHIITTSADGVYSAVTADMDGDGDLDVLSASSNDDTVAWYENDGSENFTKHTITTTADSVRAATTADVDGDGDLDVLSASSNDDTIAWYENDGSENFTKHTITTSADGARSVTTVDMDGDGDLDVLSASNSDDTIAWYENDGSENFTEHTITTSAAAAYFVTTGDMDGDGDVDVLSAAFLDDAVTWYENDGSENFTAHTITTSADGAVVVATGDVDGDGDLDVLSASESDDTIAWYENDGLSVLANDSDVDANDSLTSILVSGPSHASSFTLNADGSFTYTHDGSENFSDSFTYKTNDGTADSNTTTVTLTITPTNDAPVNTVPGAQVVAEDTALNISGLSVMDVDGNLSTVQLGVTQGTVTVTVSGAASISAGGNGTSTLTLSGTQADINATLASLSYQGTLNYTGADSLTMTSTDGNSVTDVDAVAITVTGVNDAPVAAPDSYNLLEDGSLTTTLLAPFTEQVITNTANGAHSVVAADVDGDGDLDVLAASDNGDTVAWFENIDGLGTFGAEQVITNLADGAFAVTAADVDGDGDLDVLAASTNDDTVAWYENTDGLGTFGAEQVITNTADGAYSIVATDVDGDGDLDVLAASKNDDTVAWYENTDGLGTFGTEQVLTNTADGAVDVTAADVDGDGDQDVLVASLIGDTVAWYENTDGLGTFGAEQLIDNSANGARSVTTADVDGDGDLDVVAAIRVSDTVVWYENTDGLGTFGSEQVINNTTNGPSSVMAADVDGDGDLDVVAASVFGDTVAWFENTDGLGTFGAAQVLTNTADGAISVAIADVDGDGDLDVLAASGGDDTVAWFENNDPGILFNDTDADADPLTAVLVTDVSNGTLVLNANGTFTYTPNPDFNGVDSFTYKANDGTIDSNTVTVTLTVTTVNDLPIITNLGGDALAYTEGDGAVVIEQGVDAVVSDVDSSDFDTGTLTVSFQAGSDSAEDVLAIRNQGTAAGQVGVSGSNVTYQGVTIGTFTGGTGGTDLVIALNASADATAVSALTQNITYENTDTDNPTTGNRTVRYVLTDGDGGTSTNYDTTVTVSGVDDSAVITGDISYSGNEGDTVGGTMTATDAEGLTDNTYFTVTTPATNGTAAINPATGAWTFTPTDPNWFGSDNFTVTVTDDLGGTTTQVVSITVNPVNDAPVFNTNQLAYISGQTTLLSTTNILTSDVDNLDADLTFTISGITGGQFEAVSNPGVLISTFTQEDINNGDIQFVHFGGAAPNYSLTVFDGAIGVGPVAVSVSEIIVDEPESAMTLEIITDENQESELLSAELTINEETSAALKIVINSLNIENSNTKMPETILDSQNILNQDKGVEQIVLNSNSFDRDNLQNDRTVTEHIFIELAKIRDAGRDILESSGLLENTSDTQRTFEEALSNFREEMDVSDDAGQKKIEIAENIGKTIGLTLSVGSLSWLLRVEWLFSVLLSSLPTWRHIDPLAVLTASKDDDSEDGDPDSKDDDQSEKKEKQIEKKVGEILDT